MSSPGQSESLKLDVLLELRPALAGHAGIPQETRLLFCGLRKVADIGVQGLIQSGNRILAEGLPLQGSLPPDQQIDRLSRVVVSLQEPGRRSKFAKLHQLLERVTRHTLLVLGSVLGVRQKLSVFDATHFRDFVWRSMFAKSLPYEDFGSVTEAKFRVASAPYGAMHACGLLTRKLGRTIYPRLDTRGIDVMIAQTPYPAMPSGGTHLVVRYFDAVPLLMPHTITEKATHQALHYQALRKSVGGGAHFVCCSEATRRDLIAIFPEAAPRAVTIHCMLSHHFYAEQSSASRVPEIVAKRLHSHVGTQPPQQLVDDLANGGGQTAGRRLDYLLVVSTIEPRKNHETALAAWEQLRAEKYPDLRLVCVGGLGWDHEPIVRRFLPWIRRGDVFLLEDVPADDLRLLYKHARATVCPSYAEGFGYSGVEAMRCGGVVAASNIAVHREIYDEAAEYFSPYSASDAARAIDLIIDPQENGRRQRLEENGLRIAERYLPERVLPQWRDFLHGLPRHSRH